MLKIANQLDKANVDLSKDGPQEIWDKLIKSGQYQETIPQEHRDKLKDVTEKE